MEKKLSFSEVLKKYTMVIVLVLVVIMFTANTKGVMLLPQNVNNLVAQNAYVFILATGMLFCILTGGNIDLSVGSVVCFVAAVGGKMMVLNNMNPYLTMLVMLITGIAIGAWQGFWIAYVRIPPFIVTLAGMLAFRGLSNVVLQGQTLAPMPDSYLALFNNYIPDFVGKEGFNVTCFAVGIIGFFRQKIVFPESFPLHPDFIMVYKHEHTHLKNHDNLVKLLCLFVLCLHWMNPVAYLLLFLYIDTAEIVSDSVAVDGCTKEKRQDYAKLLVLEASISDIRPAVWKNNLSGHKNNKEGNDFKTLKRRINYMMKEKRKGMLQRGIMVAVSALTVVASAGTVMAYQPTQSSDESFEEFISDGSIYDFGFEDMDDIATAAIDFSQGDSIFVDSDGNQIVYQEESSDTYALCTHSMVPATFYTHSKNSSGGCTVKIYKCQRCEKCGYSANAQYDHTITYAKCPH